MGEYYNTYIVYHKNRSKKNCYKYLDETFNKFGIVVGYKAFEALKIAGPCWCVWYGDGCGATYKTNGKLYKVRYYETRDPYQALTRIKIGDVVFEKDTILPYKITDLIPHTVWLCSEGIGKKKIKLKLNREEFIEKFTHMNYGICKCCGGVCEIKN